MKRCEDCSTILVKQTARWCKPHGYQHRTRPSGLKYEIKTVNKGWIKKGQRLSVDTEFKKGMIPANYKGEDVGYYALHDWVRRHRGAPTRCEHCDGTYKLEWANKSFEYKRDLTDWLSLCYWCHRRYDMNGNWGAATKKYKELRK